MKYPVFVLSLLIAVASAMGAETAVDSRIADIELRDQFDRPDTISRHEGSIVVIIASDQAGVQQNEEWEKAIMQSNGDNVILLRVADLRRVPNFSGAKNYAKSIFQHDYPKRSILLDWDGALFSRYQLKEKVSNLIMIDRTGYIRYMYSGAADSPAKDRLMNEIEKLKKAR
jgi:hypothetical protein